MHRFPLLAKLVFSDLNTIYDPEFKALAISHLQSVSSLCARLADIRYLNSHKAAAAGLLHDIARFKGNSRKDHAGESAKIAVNYLEAAGYDEEEQEAICKAIAVHSLKGQKDDPLSECLKDADVLSHWVVDGTPPDEPARIARLTKALKDLAYITDHPDF